MGERCNKSLSFGPGMDASDAKRRIMEWCIRGVAIPNVLGGLDVHIFDREYNPRLFDAASVRAEQELDTFATTVRP